MRHVAHATERVPQMENNTIIRVHKVAGQKKDAFRAIDEKSIPRFLSESKTVTFDGNQFHLVCVEGEECAPVGAVIGWEASQATTTGWNTWVVGNAATNLIEVDGVFYKKATVLMAAPVTEQFPEFLEGAPIVRNDDGSWTITTDWGKSTGFPGKAYWIRYGTKPDGKPDANILTKSEKSYKDYIVCGEDGEDIGYLYELDPE